MRSSQVLTYPEPLPSGLRPTIRQGMIVVLWAALLSAWVRFSLMWGLFHMPTPDLCSLLAMFFSCVPMYLLGFLLLAFDRRGPMRMWYVSWCHHFVGLLAAVGFPLSELVCFLITGSPTWLFPWTIILAPVLLVGFYLFARHVIPGRCLDCGRRAVIPTSPLAAAPALPGQSRPTLEGWCACCSARYERQGLSAWTPKEPKGA